VKPAAQAHEPSVSGRPFPLQVAALENSQAGPAWPTSQTHVPAGEQEPWAPQVVVGSQ
jgi:hypothetical protein